MSGPAFESMATTLAESSAKFAEGLELPEPAFHFTIGLAEGHLPLLEGRFTEEGEPQILIDAALKHGRVLLHGEGGVGKSTVAKRLLIKVRQEEGFAALVDLRDWNPDILSTWEELDGEPVTRADLLLEGLGNPRFNEGDLALLGESTAAIIVFDGLNETPGPTAASILEVAEEIARRNPRVGILVTDRLLRRSLPSRRWQLASVVEVSAPDGTVSLSSLARGNAFFLSLAIKNGLGDRPAKGVLDEYLSRHVGLTGQGLSRASKAAADAYFESSSRVFDLARFISTAGDDAVDSLVDGGVLRRQGSEGVFSHHLFHDDLAARWLAAAGEDQWNAKTFEALTFEANSFDALALALTRIDEPELADRFVLSVYDYNYYGTAYALAEGVRLGGTRVGQDTYLAIVAMLAERRFDPMLPTFDQVEDALRLFEDETAISLRRARSVEELLEEVAKFEVADPVICKWQPLFVTAPGSPATEQIVNFLVGANPLLGWTAANVLRRTKISPEQLARVWSVLADDERPVVRWRAAHALGSQPEDGSVERLFGATCDEDSLVRYGAVRSLVDLAAEHQSLREPILARLEIEAERLVDDPRPAKELERSLQRVESDAAWLDAITPLVEELWAKAPTDERREHWRLVARQIANPPAPEPGAVLPAA
ncbi:MAG: hypothetical protein JWO14_3012 [Solirubrobacterales bacterium]|nr:hypothetical protein [Solirubrobacterales bacterium]